MDDLEIVQEFLSEKKLDEIDKFLLEKYIKAVGNILNYIKDLEYKLKEKICFEGHQQFKELKENSIPKQVIRDKIEEKQKILDVFTDEMNNAIQEKNQNKFDLYNKGTDNMSLEIQVLNELLKEDV